MGEPMVHWSRRPTNQQSEPESGPDPATLAERVLALIPVLRQWIVAHVKTVEADRGLSLQQYAALRGIRDGAISPGELARQWQVTPAVLTGIVDRLERRGLVRREPDPRDRRRLRLALTAAGRAASAEVERVLTADLAARLAAASADELAGLDRALRLLQDALHATPDSTLASDRAGGDRGPVPETRDVPAPSSRPTPAATQRNDDATGRRMDRRPPGTKTPQPRSFAVATSSPEELDLITEVAHGAAAAATADGAVEVTQLDLRDPRFMATAYDTYAELREQGRVTRVKFGGDDSAEESRSPRDRFFNRETYFVTHYDDVVATLLDDRFSVDPRSLLPPEQREHDETPEEFRPFARSIISIDPPDHTRIRKLVQPSFTGRGMEAMRPGIQRIVDDLLDEAEAAAAARGETAPNRRMELISQFAYPFPVTVISDMLGIPREDRARIKGWTENLLRVDRGRDATMDEQVRQGLRDFTAYLEDLFARKREAPTDDMISRMVLIEDEGDTLTEEETLATVFLMYLAGHVTTVNLVGNGIVALLTHPEQMAKLRADPALARNVVEETLRYWGPVDFIGRRFATEDLQVADTPVAKGEQVAVSLAAANRDPARFADPDAFDITREEANRHVAFGKGIHVCLGAPLARVEGQVAFETLIRRYPALRLAVPAEEVAWGNSFLRGFRQVPLLF